MKLKNGLYFLFLLIACKDGGGISLQTNNSLGWAFNQALTQSFANNGQNLNFTNISESNRFSTSSGNVSFSLSSLTSFCNPITSQVKINNVQSTFAPAQCGVSKVRFYDENDVLVRTVDYYFITASRTYGNVIEFLSFGFEGSEPRTNTYNFDSFYDQYFFSGYSIYTRQLDGTQSYKYYFIESATINTNATNGYQVSSNNLVLRSGYNQGDYLFMNFLIGCCSK